MSPKPRPHPTRKWSLGWALLFGEVRIDARDGPGWTAIREPIATVLNVLSAQNDESPPLPALATNGELSRRRTGRDTGPNKKGNRRSDKRHRPPRPAHQSQGGENRRKAVINRKGRPTKAKAEKIAEKP